jgi:multiple sugar transport system substrate-binding protein
MTAPGFDAGDFAAPALAYATQPDGRMDTIPTTLHYNLLVWNKDLFAAKGVKVPATFPALLEAARALNDPKNGISGFVARGVKNANTPVWTSFLLGYGLDPIEKSGRFNTETPEAVEAAKLYTALNKDFGPPGVVGFNWYECQANFMLGKSAMFIDTEGITGLANDPKKSRVAGKVGYSVMPAGPKAHVAPMYGDGLGMPAVGKKKGAAWYFIQWATNKQNQVNLGADGAGAPARASAHVALNALPTPPVSPEWMAAITKSSAIARPCVPDIVASTEFRDVFGAALSNMLTGSDPAEQLKSATAQFKPVYAKTE